MKKVSIKTLIISALAIFLLAGVSYIANDYISQWNQNIIKTNSILAEFAVEQLRQNSLSIIEKKKIIAVLEKEDPTREEIKRIDSLLSFLTANTFLSIPGLEGGFYFPSINEFVGYSFPTSPPPVPKYGPPPRSYNIILDQVNSSIVENKKILNLHQFDPAVFPLATEPINIGEKNIGAVWARVHIERELPSLKLQETLKYAALISIIGFLLSFIAFFRIRNQLNEVKSGLEIIKNETSFRFEIKKGIFGFIGKSINEMVDTIQSEHIERQKLEHELHQQDKLASLGKLVAGVAHEVKTPLAIIKTRIQMWQHELAANDVLKNGVTLNKDSFQLVVNEIDRLSKLVKRLLHFSKPSIFNKSYNDIHQIIINTLNLIQTSDINFKIDLLEDFDTNIPPIFCDSSSLNQMFINLITNSIEAMPDGGLIKISTNLNNEHNSVIIRIADNGTGIKEEIKDKIFDPFFTTKEQGAGLGLSIVYEIVKIHNGKIKFFTDLENKTTCQIDLPFK